MNNSKERVTFRLFLPKKDLVSLWKLAAQRKIAIDRVLEELLERDALLIEAEEKKGKIDKGKIVKFPIP